MMNQREQLRAALKAIYVSPEELAKIIPQLPKLPPPSAAK